MKKLFLVISFFISLPAFSQNEEAQGQKDLLEKKGNYQINGKFKAGNYLIYDCRGGYYACVDKDGYELCENKRQEGIKTNEERYDCAPLKQYEEKLKCIAGNYSAIDSAAAKRFCYPRAD